MKFTVVGLVGAFLAAIVGANLIAAHYGPAASIYTAFGLIGLDFITRDRLADFWQHSRWLKMSLLIGAGAGLSYLLNRNAGTIAEASCIAFAAAETVEAVSYHLLRGRPWMERAPEAAVLAALVDSILFPTIAFGGVMWSVTFGQFTAKVAGALLWAALLRYVSPRVVTA